MTLDHEYEAFLVNKVLNPFYEQRLMRLKAMELTEVLKRKNPYLFKAKNIELAGEFVVSIIDAFLSSQEETMFGNLLESFAVHVSSILYGGFKSKRKSLDLEFERDGTYYIVGIKSGTEWGNADQVNTMRANFKVAKQDLRASGYTGEIVAVNGCMYGRESVPLRVKRASRRRDDTAPVDPDLTYYKYAGQEFWYFLSGDDQLYQKLIVPIGKEAKTRDEAFKLVYSAKVNEMTMEFSRDFLTPDNQIDWIKLVDFVSKKTEKTTQRL